MKINRDNYESWFLDYLDGELDAGREEILRSFLELNPDLREELEGLDPVSLDAGDIRYEMKLALRKPSPDPDRHELLDRFEDYCLLAAENQLSGPEEKIFMDIVRTEPRKMELYKLYLSTLLKPDPGIRYRRKSALKRRFIRTPGIRLAIGTAAAALLFLLLLPLMVRFGREPLAVREVPAAFGEKGTEQENTSRNPETVSKGRIETPQATPGVTGDRSATNNPPGSLKSRGETARVKYAGSAPGETSASLQTGGQTPGSVQVYGGSEGIRTGTAKLSLISSLGADPLVPPEKFLLSLKPGSIRTDHAGVSPSGGELHLTDNTGQESGIRKNRKFSFWNLADAGLRKISEISDESISLEREADDQGHTRWIKFESQVFGIAAPVKSPDSPGE